MCQCYGRVEGTSNPGRGGGGSGAFSWTSPEGLAGVRRKMLGKGIQKCVGGEGGVNVATTLLSRSDPLPGIFP